MRRWQQDLKRGSCISAYSDIGRVFQQNTHLYSHHFLVNTYWQTTSALISMNCLPSVQIFLSLWAKHLVLFMHLLFHWMPNLSWVSLYLLFFMCLCVHPRVDVNSTEKRGVQSEAMSLRGMSLLLHEKPYLHSGDFQVFTEIVWVGCRCVTSHRGIFFFSIFPSRLQIAFSSS